MQDLPQIEVPDAVFSTVRWSQAIIFLGIAPVDAFASGTWLFSGLLTNYKGPLTDSEHLARTMFAAADVYIGAALACVDLNDRKTRVLMGLGSLAMGAAHLRLGNKVAPGVRGFGWLQLAFAGILWFCKPKKSPPRSKDSAPSGTAKTK